MNGSTKRDRRAARKRAEANERKKEQYLKQEKLCVRCFLSWPVEQMEWSTGSVLVCIGCRMV